MKRNHILILIGITIVIAGAAFATQQSTATDDSGNGCAMGGRGHGPVSGMANRLLNGPGNGKCNGSSLDMTKRATFAGQVKSFEGGPGKGRPTLVLATSAGDKTFIVGPYRVLSESGMQFMPGAALTISAAPNANDDWMAIAIKDDATGKELTLRDAQTGQPAGGCRGRRS